MLINKSSLKTLFWSGIILILSACNSGTSSTAATGNAAMTSAAIASTARISIFSAQDNQQLQNPPKAQGGIDISYTLDGETQPNLNLNDMGWHLLTLTVTSFTGSPVAVEGVIASVSAPNGRGQQVKVQDVNCSSAIFSGVGDTCSAYIQISYNYTAYGLTPCLTNVKVAPGSWPNIASIGTITDNITSQTTYGDYRLIQRFETKYHTGSAVIANPNAYQMVLVQNGSIFSSIDVTTNSLSGSGSIIQIHRTNGNNDPVYGAWSECALTANAALNQVSTLSPLSSCILVYQAVPNVSAQSAVGVSNLVINTNATQSYPYNAISYQMQANYASAASNIAWQSSTIALPAHEDSQFSGYNIAFGGSTFVILSQYQTNNTPSAYYSTYGTSWTTSNLDGYQYGWNSITNADGVFFVAGGCSETYDNGPCQSGFAYSSDGINWQSSVTPVNEYGYRIGAYVNGTYVEVGSADSNGGTNAVTYVPSSWTSFDLVSSSLNWYGITYGNGKFVAIANSSNIAAYSSNGLNWTQSTLPSSQAWDSVAYGNGKFVAVASSSNIAAYSTDGINWTQSTLPSSQSWDSVAYGNGTFVAIASGSNIAVFSSDGINWTQSTLPVTSQPWNSIAVGNDEAIAVSANNLEEIGNIMWPLVNFNITSNPN